VHVFAEFATNVTPISTITSDLISYILGYGVLGVVALALAFRFLVPGKSIDDIRESARADLIEENRRLIARAEKAESQRDEALRIAQDQLIPLLTSFTATTQSLIPLLQGLVRNREEGGRRR
jgi:hypothetical protein